MDIFFGIAGFLGGGFLTSVIFIVGYAGRVATLENNVKNIKDTLTDWKEHGMPICDRDLKIEERIRALEIKEGRN